MNHPPLAQFQDARQSPTSPFLNNVENFPSSSRIHTNTRSRSNSATSAHSPCSKGDDDTVVMASPPSISAELDPTPRALQRVSQYSTHSGISAGSLSPIDAHHPIKRFSFASTSSRAASPSHRVDVPQGIDSDTDAETDTDRAREQTLSRAPPALPPKDRNGHQVFPVTTVESEGTQREDIDDAEAASSVEQTSHSTYIAPALPPIRFSMNNADFSELLSSVGGLPHLKSLETVQMSRKESQADIPVTHAITRSMTHHAEEPVSGPNSEKEGPLTPVMTVTPASEDARETPAITKQVVESHKTRSADSGPVLSKLREAIKFAKDRGALQLQVDIDMVDAVIEHIESKDTSFLQLKSKVDGMNVSAVLFDVHALTVYNSAKVNDLLLA